MAIGEGLLTNVTDVIAALPPNVISGLGGLINILKAIGIVFLIYMTYVIINGILNWRGSRRIKSMEKNIISIEKKLDLLLKGKKEKKKKK